MSTARCMVGVVVLVLVTAGVGCGESDEAPASMTDGPKEVTGAGFYDPPAALPDGEAGTLLRYQHLDDLSPGSTYRILYLSESRTGDPVAVTGLAVMPDAEPPPDGRPLLGVAHATTGIADACAPSADPENLAGELRDVARFVDAGYLVAMTDYEGLGTPGRHPYLVGGSEGRSVLDAVRAARQLPDAHAGDRLALAGYQQGGHAALWAAELADTWAPELRLVATAVGAPLSEMTFEWSVASSIDGLVYFLDLIAAGFHAGYPDTDLGSLFTPDGLAQLDLVDTGCSAEIIGATAGTRLDDILHAGAAAQEPWTSIASDNVAGTTSVDSPILIVHSQADDIVPVNLSADLATRLCAAGQQLQRVVLQDGDTHLAAASPTYTRAFEWIQARFAGQPLHSTCPPPAAP